MKSIVKENKHQSDIESAIFNIRTDNEFEKIAFEIYRQQAVYCEVYNEYHKQLNLDFRTIERVEQIPFLPIEFFKTHKVVSNSGISEAVFNSSGTTQTNTSMHYVTNLKLYEESFAKGFDFFFGNLEEYCILALLPNYYEREGSSLVYMTTKLIEWSKNSYSGFFLNNTNELIDTLIKLNDIKQKTILIGVSYALLDLVESTNFAFANTIIMETGGMKGRRKELIKTELHKILCEGFGVDKIYSEYGMTEMLSQAYSFGNGLYNSVPWMQVRIRDVNDPFTFLEDGLTGGLNIIDLSNINSCSFIATQDLAKMNNKNCFEIIGRFDNSDTRGCNLLVE